MAKINISYSISKEEICDKFVELIKEKLPNVPMLFRDIKFDMGNKNLEKAAMSIEDLRAKLFDFDFRLQEISGMLSEYIRKTEKK